MKIEYLTDHMEAIPVLASLFHKEWSHLYPEEATLGEVAKRIGERAHRDRIPMALVAHEEGELVGTVSLKVIDMDTRVDLTPWLTGLYVLESHRERGIGRALVEAVEENARVIGVKRLYLYTEKSERLYSRLGWGILERTIYRGYPVTVMSKGLSV